MRSDRWHRRTLLGVARVVSSAPIYPGRRPEIRHEDQRATGGPLRRAAIGEAAWGNPFSVDKRYRAAAGLLQFNVAMLQEGFQGRTVTPDFVQETLSPLASFGIEVVKVPPRQKLLPQPNGNS